MRTCNRCKTEKAPTEFYRNKARADGLDFWCRTCRTEYKKAWDQTPKRRQDLKDYTLRRDHGLGLDEFRQRLAAQGHRCAICQRFFDGIGDLRPCVDHDHTTDERRGILCSNCNTAIGLLADDVGRIEAAAAYLRGWKAPQLVATPNPAVGDPP